MRQTTRRRLWGEDGFQRGDSFEVLKARLTERLKEILDLTGLSDELPIHSLRQLRVLHAKRPSKHGQHRFAILTPQLVDHTNPQCSARGGGERYCVDLATLLQEYGEVTVYQPSQRPFRTNCDGVEVVGLGVNRREVGFFWTEMNTLYHQRRGRRHSGVIYLALDMCFPFFHQGSVVISHGIFWDHFQLHPHQRNVLLQVVEAAGCLVSVDTNTINWLQATKPALARKAVYLPNFADTDFYFPKARKPEGLVRVCFPRRLVEGRGFHLMVDIARELLKNYRRIAFDFVGHGSLVDEAKMRAWSEAERRVTWTAAESSEEMRKAYWQADIVIIPSLYSEGTSLSCIEAMACGKPVISTYVGGLPNLIIHGYNGLLVAPQKEEIQKAIEQLYKNSALREKLGKKAREVALCFSKQNWEQRWHRIIRQHILGFEVIPVPTAKETCGLPLAI